MSESHESSLTGESHETSGPRGRRDARARVRARMASPLVGMLLFAVLLAIGKGIMCLW